MRKKKWFKVECEFIQQDRHVLSDRAYQMAQVATGLTGWTCTMRWGVMTFTVESLRLVRMISLIVVYLFSTCKYCKDVSTRPRPPFKFSTIIHTIKHSHKFYLSIHHVLFRCCKLNPGADASFWANHCLGPVGTQKKSSFYVLHLDGSVLFICK